MELTQEFDFLNGEYQKRLNNFITSLRTDIRTLLDTGTFSRAKSLAEARLIEATNTWMKQAVKNLEVDCRKTAIDSIKAAFSERDDLPEIQNELINKLGSVKLEIVDLSSPHIKAVNPLVPGGAAVGFAIVVSYGLRILFEGPILFVCRSVVMISGGYLAWRLFANYNKRGMVELENAYQNFIEQFHKIATEFGNTTMKTYQDVYIHFVEDIQTKAR